MFFPNFWGLNYQKKRHTFRLILKSYSGNMLQLKDISKNITDYHYFEFFINLE